VPQTPAETWSLRYGDCKAKTLMLLALLHELGVEAEPVLASLQLGGLVEKRLPSAAAFDHVLVRATANGETLWLDGTGSGTRIGDLKDVPALGHVLPVRAGAALVALTPKAMARPEYAAEVELDHKAGVNLPALFKAKVVVRGGAVSMLKAMAGKGNKAEIEQMVEGLVSANTSLENISVAGHKISFDAAEATATVEANGVAYSSWSRENQRWGHRLDPFAASLSFSADRARAAWRAIPVNTGAPSNKSLTVRIKLPGNGEGFALDGAPALNEQIGPLALTRKAALANGWATADLRMTENGGEVAAADIAELRKRAAQVKARQLRVLAPAGAASRYGDVEAARGAKALAPLMAVFDARIAANPKDAQAYVERAWFREQVFERQQAVADLGRAIAIEPTSDRLLSRAELHFALGNAKAAAADAEEALALDSASSQAVVALATYKAEAGDRAGGLALLDEQIEVGGKESAPFISAKAELQAEGGDKEGALATLDEAVTNRPGDPGLLNTRCWIKGTLDVFVDTAVKDCTKAIELSDDPVLALDSRAMAYFRMNRTEDALADLEAALALQPDYPESLFLRGVLRKQAGNEAAAAADLAAATALSPRIGKQYAAYGITP
jgi:tetratricopeptide (TPR) repeat protein